MANIAKSICVLLTIAILNPIALAQIAVGGPANAERMRGDRVLKAQIKQDKPIAKFERSDGQDVEVAKEDARKLKAHAKSKALKSRGSSAESKGAGSSGGGGGGQNTPSNNGVDPCTINKNLPECKNSSFGGG